MYFTIIAWVIFSRQKTCCRIKSSTYRSLTLSHLCYRNIICICHLSVRSHLLFCGISKAALIAYLMDFWLKEFQFSVQRPKTILVFNNISNSSLTFRLSLYYLRKNSLGQTFSQIHFGNKRPTSWV